MVAKLQKIPEKANKYMKSSKKKSTFPKQQEKRDRLNA